MDEENTVNKLLYLAYKELTQKFLRRRISTSFLLYLTYKELTQYTVPHLRLKYSFKLYLTYKELTPSIELIYNNPRTLYLTYKD